MCSEHQAEDGIRDAQESRGLGDVYKRQVQLDFWSKLTTTSTPSMSAHFAHHGLCSCSRQLPHPPVDAHYDQNFFGERTMQLGCLDADAHYDQDSLLFL